MSKISAEMSVSADGFIADPNDDVGPLFDWYATGPVAVPSADPRWSFQVSEPSAERLRTELAKSGALICGRRLFDHTGGWGGNHPVGVPVFVVTHSPPRDWTHPDAPFTFVTDGVASAVEQAKAVAGDRTVLVASPTVIQQSLDLDLLDELTLSLVPVLLGRGIRMLDNLNITAPIMLENPEIVAGDRVTHLTYRVRSR